jgi:hypothetical protein
MIHYGSKSPKRHVAFSNNKAISKLYMGQLSHTDKMKASKSFKPVRKYIDKHGKKRFSGTADLRETQHLACSPCSLYIIWKALGC